MNISSIVPTITTTPGDKVLKGLRRAVASRPLPRAARDASLLPARPSVPAKIKPPATNTAALALAIPATNTTSNGPAMEQASLRLASNANADCLVGSSIDRLRSSALVEAPNGGHAVPINAAVPMSSNDATSRGSTLNNAEAAKVATAVGGSIADCPRWSTQSREDGCRQPCEHGERRGHHAGQCVAATCLNYSKYQAKTDHACREPPNR